MKKAIIATGLPSAEQLVGRHARVGRVKAHQAYCNSHEEIS